VEVEHLCHLARGEHRAEIGDRHGRHTVSCLVCVVNRAVREGTAVRSGSLLMGVSESRVASPSRTLVYPVVPNERGLNVTGHTRSPYRSPVGPAPRARRVGAQPCVDRSRRPAPGIASPRDPVRSTAEFCGDRDTSARG
jgi:hypothetical protein